MGKRRTQLAFWIFGLCGHYVYTLMLTGAKDITQTGKKHGNNTNDECLASQHDYRCNKLPTAAVILCNGVPALAIQFVGPLLLGRVSYRVRVLLIVLTSAAALIMAGVTKDVAVALTAVAVGSLSFGFCEMTFLALSSKYTKDTIAKYSCGIGFAGLCSSFSYSLLTGPLKISPGATLLIMLFAPALILISYFFILEKPNKIVPKTESIRSKRMSTNLDEDRGKCDRENNSEKQIEAASTTEMSSKLSIFVRISPFFMTVCFDFFMSFLANQELVSIVPFACHDAFGMTPNEQFRWTQVAYRCGAFISRTVFMWWNMPTWTLFCAPILQIMCCTVLLLDALFVISLPHIAISMFILSFLGFSQGAIYINAGRKVHARMSPADREFAMTALSPASFVGILVAGLISLPMHPAVCKHSYS